VSRRNSATFCAFSHGVPCECGRFGAVMVRNAFIGAHRRSKSRKATARALVVRGNPQSFLEAQAVIGGFRLGQRGNFPDAANRIFPTRPHAPWSCRGRRETGVEWVIRSAPHSKAGTGRCRQRIIDNQWDADGMCDFAIAAMSPPRRRVRQAFDEDRFALRRRRARKFSGSSGSGRNGSASQAF